MKRLWSLFRSRRLDRQLDDEIAAHLAMQEEEFRARGMSAREARDAARREFGGVTQTVEAYRDRRGVPWIETAAKDLRYALRALGKNKAFTAAAVLSLALGIGANTAIFTLFRALMLRALPVARPEELVTLYRTGGWGRGYSSYPLYLEIRKRADLFQDVIARSGVDKVRIAGDRMETAQREFVTGNYFSVLGIHPAIGRVISEDENRTPHAHPVAVLSYDYWQTRFGGDPGVIGRNITASEQPLTIIGVAAHGFRGIEVDRHPDLWVPAMMRAGEIMEPGANWAWIVGRRRPDVSRRQIQAAVDVLLKQYLARVYPETTNPRFRKVALAQQIEAREGAIGLSMLREEFGTALGVLMAAVGLVLLAACANVANLLFARGAARRKEMALRVSLGATRGRLLAQALIESLLLAVFGAIAGVALAYWGTRAILEFLPQPFRAEPDATVLAFTLGLTALAAILFGLGPAAQSAGVDPAMALRGLAGGLQPRPAMRRTLVVVQVAFSVVLVVLAGLFGHSMAQLRSVDVGFHNQNVVAFSMDFPPAWKAEQKTAARERLVSQIENMPGVVSVSHGAPGPFMSGSASTTVTVPGSAATTREPAWVAVQAVAPRYFETIGATLVAGREVTPADTAKQARLVAIVNEAFARQFLPGEPRLLDRVLMIGKDPITIVGVVHDIAHDGVRTKPAATVYVPWTQIGPWEPVVVARGSLPPDVLAAGIRAEAAKLGGQVAVSEPRTIRRRIDDSLLQDRLLATFGGFFGGLALALAAVGLYGVVAYGTARRAREIGIRIALGARRGSVLRMVLGDALLLVAGGLALGLPASYAAAKQVSALLFGVQPMDSVTFITTAAVLAIIGVAAALVPARRASRLEPLAVLRQE